MSSITTRSGKGSPLTNSEVDANFTNLNTDKLENITSESIKSLSDVYSSMSPSDGQALVFDSTNGWQAENVTTDTSALMPKAGGTFTGNVTFSTGKIIGPTNASGLGMDIEIPSYYGLDVIYTGGASNEFLARFGSNGAVQLYHNGNEKFATSSTGATINGTLIATNLTVSGNIAVTGSVDGRDIAAMGTKLDGVENNATADQTKADIDALNINADLLDGQHGSYYTGYVDTAISNLVDSSPSALNTLNELAAALGDDANFSSTITTSIGTKLPKSGGTMTGNINLDTQSLTFSDSSNQYSISSASSSALKIQAGAASGQQIDVLSNTIRLQNQAGTKTGLQSTPEGATTLYHNNAAKIATSSSGVDVTGDITFDGSSDEKVGAASSRTFLNGNLGSQLRAGNNTKVAATTTGVELTGATTQNGDFTFTGASYNAVWDKSANSLRFADNAKAVFGDGSDASIHWNGSALEFSSELGDVIIRGNNEIKLQAHTGENFFVGLSNGASTLYYDNSAKLATSSSGATVTGNIVVSGTVDGRDVASDGTKLDGIAAGANVGIGSLAADSSPQLGGVLDVNGQAIDFGDDDYLRLGNNNEHRIYHKGTGSVLRIEATSAGKSIEVRGGPSSNSFFSVLDANGTNIIKATMNGSSSGVTLHHGGGTKLATSSSGITVTGTLAATAVTGDGSGLTNLPAGASNVGTGNFIGGTNAGANLESGAQENTILGNNAGNDVTSGRYNTLVGKDAGPLLTTAQANTFMGWETGKNTTGGANTFLGYRAGRYATTGFSNVFVGYETGDGNFGTANTGQYNTAIGSSALGGISSGQNNVAVGYTAGDNITSGSRNIVIGQGADASSATVSNEITIGSQNHTSFRMPGVQHLAANGSVLQYNSATGLIGLSALQTDLIYDASPQLGGNLDTRTHNINFPQLNSSSMSSNYLSFGGKFFFVCQQGYNRIISDSSSTGFEIKGNVMKLMTATGNEEYLLATKDGSVKLYYDGSSKFETTSTGITVTGDVNSTSDIRAKKNIETIEDALEKVSLLRGVTFDWDNDVEERATGVIAQDVEKVLPEAVRDNAETGFKSVAYGNMVGLLVEAIKEQQTQIDELKDQVKKLNG